MEKDSFLRQIETAQPKELSDYLNKLNRDNFLNNDWSIIAVKAAYSELVNILNDGLAQCKQFLEYGNEKMKVHDCLTGEDWSFSVRQAISNIEITLEFLKNPPIVDNPITEEIEVDDDKIDWSKPLFTPEEVRALLKVSENTLRKWMDEGWMSYTRMPGSPKTYISRDDLQDFLKNPLIYFPRSKR